MRNLKENDLVLIQSKAINNDMTEEFWPARFIQETNVRNMCIVEIIPSKYAEGNENILVGIDKIVPYEQEKLLEEQRMMLEEGKEQKAKKKPERKELELKRSLELCQIVEAVYMNYAIKKPFSLPVFRAEGGIPLKEPDLQLYFKRRTTQIMAFLIDHIDFSKAQEAKRQMKEWKSQIIKETIRHVSDNRMTLMLHQ